MRGGDTADERELRPIGRSGLRVLQLRFSEGELLRDDERDLDAHRARLDVRPVLDGDVLHVVGYGERRHEDHLRNRGRPSGFSKVAAPMMTTAMRRANRKDLERLKQILVSTSG